MMMNLEAISAGSFRQISGRPIGLRERGRLNAEGFHAATRGGRRPAAGRTIVADQQQAVPVISHQRGEGGECSLQRLRRIVAIEVVWLDPQDGRLMRPKVQKIAAIFAGLDDHYRAASPTPSRLGPQRHGADDDRRIQSRLGQDMGRHGGSGRFAVGAGDRQAAFSAARRPNIWA